VAHHDVREGHGGRAVVRDGDDVVDRLAGDGRGERGGLGDLQVGVAVDLGGDRRAVVGRVGVVELRDVLEGDRRRVLDVRGAVGLGDLAAGGVGDVLTGGQAVRGGALEGQLGVGVAHDD